MKNWKDKVLGIFAGIGLMSLLMGNYVQQPKGVWELHEVDEGEISRAYVINSQTGVIKKLARGWPSGKKEREKGTGLTYVTMRPYNSTDE